MDAVRSSDARGGTEPAASPRLDGRAARARATRARIIATAAELFTRNGYASTSIEAIASTAGVGVQTVYYTFGTKRSVLTAALDHAIAGDDEPVITLDRPWAVEALATAHPCEQLRRQVEGAAAIYARAAALLDVVRSAAATDSDLAKIWRTNIEQRRTVQRAFANALAGKTRLRRGMEAAEAADIALAILSPESYNLLVTTCGWPAQRWKTWATDALIRQLTELDDAGLDEGGEGPTTAHYASGETTAQPIAR